MNKDNFSPVDFDKLNKMQRMHLKFILKVHRKHISLIFILLAVFCLSILQFLHEIRTIDWNGGICLFEPKSVKSIKLYFSIDSIAIF